jgi:hypothetical protein
VPAPPAESKNNTASTVFGVIAIAITVIVVLTLVHAGGSHNAADYPLGAYPANVETMFLNICEAKGAVTACTCALNYLEQHETANQMLVDADYIGRTGIYPASFQGAIATCRGL